VNFHNQGNLGDVTLVDSLTGKKSLGTIGMGITVAINDLQAKYKYRLSALLFTKGNRMFD
jgi:hypothetical protein